MKQAVMFMLLLLPLGLFPQSLKEAERQGHVDRVEGWRTDLNFLATRVAQVHFNYTHTISKENWNEMVQELHRNIPELSDFEVIVAMMKLMAAVGDGHTNLYPPFQGPYAFKALPLEFYFFKEGLYIRGAAAQYKNLAGSRVVAMGPLTVEEVVKKCAAYLGHDNDMQLKWIIPVALSFSDIYQLLAVSGSREVIELTLEDPNGSIYKVAVQAGDLGRDPMGRFVPAHWTDMGRGGDALWTRDPDNHYWYHYLEDKKMVYCQWNQVQDKPEQGVREFSRELFNFIDSHEVETLVLDIRLNNGGNNFLNKPFIHGLICNSKVNVKGKLFTIIGRRTFSAAMNLASDLENHTETLFVGEPTASKPNFYGEENGFTLPYSGLSGSISSRYWQGGQTSDDERAWIVPQLPAELEAGQYRNNEDPALEAIFTYLETTVKP